MKNRLKDAKLTEIISVKLNGQEIGLDNISMDFGEGQILSPKDISKDKPMDFPLRKSFDLIAKTEPLEYGKHKIEVKFRAKPFGKLTLKVDCSVSEPKVAEVKIPRDPHNDYGTEAIKTRQEFVEKYCGTEINHIKHYSFDPETLKGNIEHFTGVAQIPLGFAGPLTVNGEHAKGDFLIPMATTEGYTGGFLQ